MKNTWIVISLILLFLVLYFLQVNFFCWFTIAGVMPNLFVIYLLFIGLFGGKRLGIPLGILFGLCLDFFTSKQIGISAIMLGSIGALAGFLDKNFSKDSRITILLMITGVTAIYEVGVYVMNYLIASSSIEILAFMKIVAIEIFYHIILGIILYPLFQKVGYYMEEAFRGKQILTRYF